MAERDNDADRLEETRWRRNEAAEREATDDAKQEEALASEIAQEKAEDERPFGPESDRDEGGEA